MTHSYVARPASGWIRSAAAALAFLFILVAGAGAMGENGGIRLLLHVDDHVLPAGGKVETDPCEHRPGITQPDELVINVEGDQDTVWAWVYLYHPLEMAVKGFGFGIEYEGVKVIKSGTCADSYYQEKESMGPWAESGSEIAYAWTADRFVSRPFEPVAWFLLERLERDGFFSLYEGRSAMAGAVGDTNHPAWLDEIWDYGSIGFGDVAGEAPVPNPSLIPGSWGTIRVEIE